MSPEQVRMIRGEITTYGVDQREVAARCGVDPSAVSHVIAGKRSRSRPIRAMIARMILAKKLKIDPPDVPEKAVDAEVERLFKE